MPVLREGLLVEGRSDVAPAIVPEFPPGLSAAARHECRLLRELVEPSNAPASDPAGAGAMNVFELRQRLIEDYAEYTRSFLGIADGRIRALVDQHLADGLLWPHPLIQLNPAFRAGTMGGRLRWDLDWALASSSGARVDLYSGRSRVVCSTLRLRRASIPLQRRAAIPPSVRARRHVLPPLRNWSRGCRLCARDIPHRQARGCQALWGVPDQACGPRGLRGHGGRDPGRQVVCKHPRSSAC